MHRPASQQRERSQPISELVYWTGVCRFPIEYSVCCLVCWTMSSLCKPCASFYHRAPSQHAGSQRGQAPELRTRLAAVKASCNFGAVEGGVGEGGGRRGEEGGGDLDSAARQKVRSVSRNSAGASLSSLDPQLAIVAGFATTR